MGEDEFCCEGGVVFAGDDKVGLFTGRGNVGVVHGAHGAEVLLGNRFWSASAFGDITGEATRKADVCIGIDEYSEIEKVT